MRPKPPSFQRAQVRGESPPSKVQASASLSPQALNRFTVARASPGLGVGDGRT